MRQSLWALLRGAGLSGSKAAAVRHLATEDRDGGYHRFDQRTSV